MPLAEVKLKSFMDQLAVFAFLGLAFTPACDAFFRNLMIGDTAMARIDPIVDRGEPAKHVHHLSGGRALDFESTGDTLATSNCTNSLLTQDKSAYWTPWMYFQHENGTFEPVELAMGLTAYYKYEKRGNTGGDVEYSVFPKGLKMVSGDTDKRTWTGPWPVPEESLWGPEDMTQDALQAKAMGFNCMNYEPGKNEPTFAFPYLRNKDFLDQNCINGVRAEIVFPSCWDGKNLDSDDHKSHVAFPTLIQDGVCPETHPVYFPIMFFETIWNTQDFKDDKGQFVLANGDPTGYGYHADFIAAWDDGVQEAVRDSTACTGLGTSGEINSCPVFDGKIQSKEDALACKLTLDSAIADEQTDGILDALPGGVKVKGVRHDPGTQAGNETYAPSVSVPETRSSALATASAASSGYYHSQISSADLTTVTTPPSLPTGNIPSTATSTYTSDNFIVEMVLVQMFETVTATTAPSYTQTVVVPSAGPVGDSHMLRHIRKHVHNHGHF